MMPGKKFLTLNRELYAYITAHGHNRDPLLKELAEETATLGPAALMQIAPEQGTLMGILARAIGARSALEIGTFTGYSSICVARALPDEGHLLCLDVSSEWTSIARRYWERAGLSKKITLKLGAAADTLRGLSTSQTFDFAFIDADKQNYQLYYKETLKRLRRDGLMVIDNVLWSGRVLDPNDQAEDTKEIRALNELIASDGRVEAVMLSVADGITVVRKK